MSVKPVVSSQKKPTRRMGRRWWGAGLRDLVRWPATIVAVGLLAASGPNGTPSQAPHLTTLAPNVIFYEPPAAGMVAARQAQSAWTHLAPDIAAEMPAGTISGVLFAHLYTTEEADFTSAEWVFVALTGAPREQSAVLLRFRFQDLSRIASYRVNAPGTTAIDRDRAMAIMRQMPLYRGVTARTATLDAVDGFYFLVLAATDFGGTEVLTRNDGERVFAATTIAGGDGRLLFPPMNQR